MSTGEVSEKGVDIDTQSSNVLLRLGRKENGPVCVCLPPTIMIHSVIIVNLSGNIIFSKYFDAINDEEKFQWETRLFKLTHEYWKLAQNEKQLVAMYRYEHTLCVFTFLTDQILGTNSLFTRNSETSWSSGLGPTSIMS